MVGFAVFMASSAVFYFFHRFPIHVYKAKNDSMAPTLYLGDLFGVERFSAWFGTPKRFDVVSYRYPMDQSKRLIHRVVGLPKEKVRIEKGDIWVRPKGESWRVLHKPEDVQELLWREVNPAAGTPAWHVFDEEGISWKAENNRLEASTHGSARWGAPGTSIMDSYEHGHSGGRRVELKTPPGLEENVVGDVRLSGWVRSHADCSEAWIEFHEGKKTYRFSIPGPAAMDGAAPGIRVGKTRKPGQPYKLTADKEVYFRATNLDDRLSFEVDGVNIATLDIDAVAPRFSEVNVCFANGGGVWKDLVLERDVHYVSPPDETFNVTVPADNYLLLGDNPQHFMDPRFWRVLKLHIKGEDGTETYKGNLHPTENPRTFVEGGETWIQFRDEHGKKHEFLRKDIKKRSYEPSPFVPRAMIEGRVLWGLNG
jgi:signal peptidase I